MTRDELKAEILVWAKRDANGLPLDRFVDNAYDQVAREVKPQALDVEHVFDPEQATVVRGSVYAHPLPADYLQAVEVTNNGVRLRSGRPGALQELANSNGSINRPALHCIVGTALWTSPGIGGDLRMVYCQKDAALTGGDSTNYGTMTYPDVYLYASMRQVGIYEENPDMIAVYDGEFQRRRDEINLEAMRGRRGGGVGGPM